MRKPFTKFSGTKLTRILSLLVLAGIAQQSFAAGPAVPAANALPTGGQVTAGQATIAQSGNTMNINQSSQRAVVNWNSFDVGSQATVNFNQPNANAATLNYVNSASPSMINGAVNANGQVVFVNQNGVVFGKNAEVNVGGMVATTMNTSSDEFMAGNATQTYTGGTTGKVVNHGQLTANNLNGYIALMAPQVKNTGVITASMSGANAVALVAGQKVSLTFSGSQLVSVSVDASVVNALISNKLLIKTNGGQIIIAANAAGDLMGSTIKNTGVISASSISTAGGKVSLTGATVKQNGTVVANSDTSTGGQVVVTGTDVTLGSQSKTTATGATGGGQVLVGTTTSSVTSSTTLAKTVNVKVGAVVDASATQNGNGGTVSIWSQNNTTVAGTLKATGGAISGNGGNVETSSHGQVQLATGLTVDASAAHGKAGNWTLDPQNITVDATSAALISQALETTNVTLDATGSACGFGACSASLTAVINLLAGADIHALNTSTVFNLLATGGIVNINDNITVANLNVLADTINVYGNLNSNAGNNGNMLLAGVTINLLGSLGANGNSGSSGNGGSGNSGSAGSTSGNGSTSTRRRNGASAMDADTNTYITNGGHVQLVATGDITIGSNSYISANGLNGGNVSVVSTTGSVTVNGMIDSVGKLGVGGNVMIAGKTITDIVSALISVDGLTQGGMLNLGVMNNLGNGSTLAPPATGPPAIASFITSALPSNLISSNIIIDTQTSINAPNGTIVVFGDQIQINNSSLAAINGDIAIGRPSYSQGAVASLVAISNSTLTANRVETSGDLLGTQNTVVVSNEWLLDPTTVTITAAASTGGTLASALAATGASNISTADIVAAINAGNTVNVVATGAITQTGALAFAPATGITGTLILDNHLTQGSSITSSGGITSSGAGTVNLQFLAGGQSIVSGAITASSGPINVVMQSYWKTNTTNFGYGATVLNTAPITTRGGYVIMDGTGGTIDLVNQTITMGTVNVGYLQNIYPQASINTTTNAGVVSATSTGGNFIGAGYDAVSGGSMGAYESSGATLNIGGFVNIQAKSAGTNLYSYVIAGYGPGPINAAGNINITNTSSSTGLVGGAGNIYLWTGTTLTSYTGSVNISNNSTGNAIGLTINAAISAATGITINNTNVGAIGVLSYAAGTLATTAGTISITSTSTGSGVYAVSLAGLITAPKVTITGTNSTAGGLGASVTGGVTITNVAGTYASVGDALNITTTVGTNGTAGGINVTTGAITNNSNGGDVTFKTNGDITATSAVSFATANTTNHVQTLTYDTRTGNLNSQITAGIFTFNATGATSKVNYQILSNGSALTVPAVTVSGTILLDNTCASNASYTCSTPLTASSATTVSTTASVGISLTGAQISGRGITINGINASTTNAAVAMGTSSLTVTNAASFPNAGVNAISVIGLKNTANIGNPGITSTGALAVQSSGGDILFKSNGDVSQSGAVTLAANNTGHAQAVTYDVTSANQNASIVAGVLTYTASSSPASNPVNFSALASGGYLTVSATTVSGSITADNTYGCTGASCTPASGYLNMSTISTSNASTGVYVSGSLSAGSSITINGASASSAAGTADGAVTLAAITISGSQVRAGNQINISGFSNGASAGHGLAFEGNVTINSGTGPALVGGDINVLAVTSAPACCSGFWMNPTAVAKVSANAYGSSINFGTEATPIQGVIGINGYASSFNTLRATTVGGVGGNINIYAQSYASGYSAAYIAGTITADANVVVRASKTDAGLAVALNLSAAITSNNGSVSITGTTSSAAYYGASITGVINGYAGVTIFGGPNGAATGGGVSDTATITSAAGPVSITGISTTAMAVSDTALITGNSITVTGTGTTAATVVSLGAMTINACSAGVACNSNNISVTGNDSAAGNKIGITQTGAITDNASGGNILFKSNNQIVQNGTISIAQNTSGTPSSIVYDTTLGNKLSLINAGAVTFNGTSTSYINYSNITAGAEIIVNSALNVPGSITFDNTYINGVQGAINSTNAWNNATTASVAIPITASLTAKNGIYIRGAVGATSNIAAPGFDAITITGGTAVAPIVLQTTGVFAAGADAINIVGIEPSQNTTKNAINIANYTQINNNSTAASGSSWGGNTNIVAYSGRYNDAITVTNASTAGAIEVSAIGSTASIVTVAGTLFTQNSNAGIFIATSENGNVTPPKIVNNGTGPVVIEAGAYLAVGTVSTSCAATACGQITAVSGNNITSPNGNVYLYAGSPGVTAGTTSTEASLGLLSPSLGDFTLSNTLFSQAYAAGNVAATSLPIFTLGGINTANVAGGTGGTSWNTGAITSTNTGPVIQFRISPSYTATLSGNVTKVYGTNDPLASAGNINTVGSLDYQLQALYDKTANNSGWVSNGTVVGTGSSAITCASTAGCALITVNSVNFVVPLGAFVNSLQALPPTPRASYGTLAGEQVNTNSTSYTYNITSTHGISVSSGVTINSSSFGNVGLVITPAPLTITASNQAVQAGTALPLGTTAFTSTGLITTVDGVTLGDSITSSTLTSNGLTTVPTTLASGVYAPPNVNSITPSAAVFAPVSGSRGAANYAITYVGGTLTSSASAIVTITALADTKIYGNSSTSNGVTYNSSGIGVVTIGGASYSIAGLPNGDALTGLSLTSLGGIATAPVGSSYQITPSAAVITGGTAVTLNYVSALMTVQPRPITIAAVGITTTYGTPVTVSQNQTTGYTIGGSGLGASDTLTSVAVNYYNGTTNSTTVPGSTGAATYNAAITTSAATGTGGFNSTNYNITYTPANLVVNKLAVTLTANAQSTPYGTALALGTTAFTSSISSLPNGDTITGATLQYNSSATVPGTTNALTYTGGIVASSATGTGGFGATNYAITYSPGNLTVTPANVVITPADVSASGQTVMYNGAAQTFNPSTGFTVTGLQNGQTPVFGATGLASATNVGTYANNITSGIITGLSSGSLSNYNISVSAQGSLTITPAPLTVAGATSNVAYNGSLQNNANPVVTGLVGIDTQVGNGVTITGKSSGTNAGTYNDALSVAAAGATQLSNYTITKTNGSLVISKLAATVTGATTVNPYTGLLQTNTYTTTGILSGDTANVTIAGSAAATHVSQGTVPDVFSVSGSASGNYAFTYAPGSITITPVALSVVGANTTQVYNATTQTNSVATVTGLKASDTATIGGSYGAGKNVGTYADALTVGLSNSSDYTIGVTNGSITITPATITISGITANNKVYNATTAATLNIGTITYSGVFAGDTVSVNTSNLSGTFVDKNVGTAKTVNISGVVLGGSSSANYQLSGGANTTTTANITPAPLTITGSNLTTTYNGAAQSLTSPTVAGVIAGDNVVVATTGGTGTNAGVYATSYAASGTDAGNYTVTSNTPTLTINKASLVVAANNSGKVVNQLDPTLSSTVSGLQGSDTASSVFVSPYGGYTTTRATGESAGSYAITASGPATLQNYNVTYTPATFTIAGAGQLLITMNAATTTYGTAATPTIASVQYGSLANSTLYTLTVASSSGNAVTYTDGAGGTITITPSITGASVASNVGSYALATANTNTGTATSAGNFTSVLTVANTLTITPAPLTLTVADVSKTYNANAVTAAQITAGSLTGGVTTGVTVTGGALMNSQTIADLGGVVYTGAAVGAINASSTPYAINGSVGSGFSNYAVTVVPGALTVNTAPLVVNGALTTRTYNGALQTNAAATIAGLQGSDTLTVAGLATGTHAGTTADALVATGAAASNYSITYNNGALTINPAALLVTGANNQYAYNGALQTNTGASVSGLKGSDTATVAGYATATHVAQGIVPDVLVATVSSPSDYAVTYVQGSLQITPIVITAAVNTATVMYNAASQTTGFVVTGLKVTDTATAASGTATGTNVGTYTSNLVLNTSSDYTVGAITNGTLTITPAPLTISGGLTANNKVYDTTNAATIGVTGNQTLAGVLGTDAVTVSSTGPYTGATFTQSNVGSGLTVTPATTSSVINGASYTTMAGVTLGGAAAGNYYVAGVGPQTLTANITPAPLTISSGLTANNKAYDGTTAATISSATQTLAGVLVSDVGNVAISSSGPYTGAFSQSNVGTGLAVSASTTPTTIAGGTYNAMTGVTLSGSAQGNYYVAGLSAPIAANITPYIINFGSGSGPNIAAVANNKVYTSTTAANGSLSMVNLFGTDSVSVSYTSAAFASPNVATGAAVTFNGVTLSGASAANYSIGSTPVTATANITPALLTITAVDKSSFYSQGLATLTQAPAIGLLGSDTVTGATITTTATSTGANAAVGAYPITISAATGSGLSNYSISYVPATYTIVGPGALAITTAGVTTPYGTGTSGNIVAPALPTATYTTGGTNISSLTYVSSSTTGDVTSYVFRDAALNTVTFNLTPSNTTTSTSNNINVGSYAYAASNLSAVATGLTSAIPSGNFTVTPLAVTITAPAATHAYNGAVQTQLAATASPAILTNDLVTVSGAASGKNVGVYGSNLATSGLDAGNYNFTYVNANLTITPFIIGSGGSGAPSIAATANNKVYDTTTVASGALAMTNLFAGDSVSVAYTSAAFASPNVANGLTVSFSGVTLSGAAAANYSVASVPTATANITPAPLTISAGLTANNKVYDTTNAATIAVTGTQSLAGVLGTDVVSVRSTGPYTGATFSQSNVGSGLTVTPATSVVNGVTTMTGVTLTGAAANNYYVAGVGPQTLVANITPAPLTINAGLTANNKAYDGTTAATISSASQTLAGVLAADLNNVAVSSSGPYNATFASKNVANGITVTPNTTPTVIAGGTYNAMSGVTLSGSAASNYYVTGTASPITANITPYIINFGSGTGPNITAVADSKVYTSTNTANGALSMVNLFPGDSVAVSYATATFASSNVANGITVTFNTPALSGASAANYSIGSTAITAPANITPAPLTITAVNKSSFYSQSLATLTQAPAVGLLGSDTVTGATISTTASTTGVNASAGAYPIAISAATGSGIGNYSITYIPATYTIVAPGALMITTAGATTPYGTSTSGNIITPAQPVASYSTGGSNISALTFVSAATVGNVTSYVYRDATSALVSFNLIPTGTTTSTSGNIVVGSYAYAASNLVSASSGLTSGSAIASGNLTVTPLAVTITAPTTAALTYNGQVQTQGPAVASPAILTNDLVTVSGAASGKNVGVYGSNLAVSGVDASNYTFTLVNKNITITPYVVTPGSTTGPRLTTAANNKVYDTTTAATGSLAMAGLFPGDSVAVNYSSAAFASANVNLPASPQTVTFSGVTLSGASASNYSIASGAITATANITPAPVTISGLVANNKVYTSTTADVISGTPIVTGLLGSDTSTATGTAVGTFASPNVANGISVAADLSGMTLSNSNYVITGLTAPLAANITPAPLTISSGLFAQNKVYDTTTAGIIAAIGTQTLAGVLGSDAANLAVSSSGPYTGSFSQASVGNGLTVSQATVTTVINGQSYTTMAGVNLSGSAAGNYYVTGPTTALTANITKAPLTITAINQASFVTQPIGALTYASIGLLGSDTISAVTLATAASNTQAAGQYAINASNATGAAIGNYQVTYAPGTYTIVPAGQLLIQSSGAVTPYTTAATFANPTVAYATSSGAVINNLYLTASSTVNGITTYTYSDGAGASLSFNFAPKNPVISGSNNVSVGTYGLSAANFVITGNNITNISPVVTGDLTVTPRAITIIATPATYVYNGTVRVLANNAATAGIVAGDLVTVADLTGGKNVGNYFSALTTTGVDAKNYQASFVNANLKITPYVLGSGVGGPAISATANNKVYNSTTDATGSLAMTGLFPGDVVAVNFTSAAFANPSVNNGVTVTFNGVTLSGADAANYVLGPMPVTATANITPVPSEPINNMAIVQQQATPEFVPERPTYLINKGDLIYVRDKDDLPKYLQAIEVPPSGAFKFPVPDQIIQELINLSGENVTLSKQVGSYKLLLLPNGSRLVVTLPDDAPLPAGIRYDAASKGFSAPKLGEVTLPLSVKVTLMRGNKVLSQKIMVVTK